LILFTIAAGADALAFGGRARVEVTQQLRHVGYVVGQQDWRGFL
jgi:hypothetical protein